MTLQTFCIRLETMKSELIDVTLGEIDVMLGEMEKKETVYKKPQV